MSRLRQIAKEIEKRKNLEINLPKYMNTMVSTYYSYGYVHMALNYYTWGEVLTEDKELPASIKELAMGLNQVIKGQVLQGVFPDRLEHGIEVVDKIRSGIIKQMNIVTSYAEHFQIYEYILNRIEFQFNQASYPEGYTEESFVQEIMDYITSDKEGYVIHSKINEIVSELPMRMARQRYFEIVKDSLSLYLGNEKANFQDMIYMLRSGSALDNLLETTGEWEKLYHIYTQLTQADFQNMEEEEFRKLQEQMNFVSDYIKHIGDMYMRTQEIVNDVYMILLSMPYAMAETNEIENCKKIITYVLEKMESEKKDSFEGEESNELTETFEKLEGKQEHLYELFSENDYLLDTMDELEETIKSIMADKLYLSLKQMAKLSSDSIFIELYQTRDTTRVDEEYLEQEIQHFMESMEDSFQKNPKIVNRARMAATLQQLPVFFRNLDECREYIEQALGNCSNKQEKLASVYLIYQLMEM